MTTGNRLLDRVAREALADRAELRADGDTNPQRYAARLGAVACLALGADRLDVHAESLEGRYARKVGPARMADAPTGSVAVDAHAMRAGDSSVVQRRSDVLEPEW